MIPFGRLLSYPLTFKNLEPKIKELKVERIEATESGGVITVDSDINGHHNQMLIHGSLIESNLPVQVYCDWLQLQHKKIKIEKIYLEYKNIFLVYRL